MKTGLKFEPIVDLRTDEVLGYEVLFKSDVPNNILFAAANTEMDHYVLHMLDAYQQTAEYRKIMIENPNTFFTLNINIESVIKYVKHIDRLESNICLDISSKSFLSNPNIELILIRHAKRLFLDDFLAGNATHEVLQLIRPRGVKFYSGLLNRKDEDILEEVKFAQPYCDYVIFKKIENLDMLDRIKYFGDFAQGYVFNNMNLYYKGLNCTY